MFSHCEEVCYSCLLQVVNFFSTFYFQLETKRAIESANRELERKAALFKHDLKEVNVSTGFNVGFYDFPV